MIFGIQIREICWLFSLYEGGTGEGILLDDGALRTVRCVQRMSLFGWWTYGVVISSVLMSYLLVLGVIVVCGSAGGCGGFVPLRCARRSLADLVS